MGKTANATKPVESKPESTLIPADIQPTEKPVAIHPFDKYINSVEARLGQILPKSVANRYRVSTKSKTRKGQTGIESLPSNWNSDQIAIYRKFENFLIECDKVKAFHEAFGAMAKTKFPAIADLEF